MMIRTSKTKSGRLPLKTSVSQFIVGYHNMDYIIFWLQTVNALASQVHQLFYFTHKSFDISSEEIGSNGV